MQRLLVHLHLYYHDQIDFMIKRLESIRGCSWDLYVTVVREDLNSTEKILKLKPDTHILKVDNIGYDILPFINVLRQVDLFSYDCVLKIHTKSFYKKIKRFNKTNVTYGFDWRNYCISSLVASEQVFKNNLKLLKQDQNGMIVNRQLYVQIAPANRKHPLKSEGIALDKLKKRLNITTDLSLFLAGTMFMAKSKVFEPLVNSDISDKDFNRVLSSGQDNDYAHVLERVFCMLAANKGYQIVLVDNQKMADVGFFHNIFSVRDIYKTIIVVIMRMVLSIRYKLKNYLKHNKQR